MGLAGGRHVISRREGGWVTSVMLAPCCGDEVRERNEVKAGRPPEGSVYATLLQAEEMWVLESQHCIPHCIEN